jgi:hypothetical protein
VNTDHEDDRMTVELLYFDGCPNHEALLPQLEELLRAAGVARRIVLRKIGDDDAAVRERFLGSPTVRDDERDDFGLKCRLYRAFSGLRGTPLDEWVLGALAHSTS